LCHNEEAKYTRSIKASFLKILLLFLRTEIFLKIIKLRAYEAAHTGLLGADVSLV